MDIRKIRKLIELINETGVGEIEVKSGKESVRISRFSTSPATTNLSSSTASYLTPTVEMPLPTTIPQLEALESKKEIVCSTRGYELKAPMVGTVYLAPTPGAKPFVTEGQRVSVGDTLCLIEAMKMFNKIEADRSGTISARCVENEQPVEFDQTLFIIEPNE